MKSGVRAWFIRSLWEKAERVTIVKVQYDEWGRVSWVDAQDKLGNQISAFANCFSLKRPCLFR